MKLLVGITILLIGQVAFAQRDSYYKYLDEEKIESIGVRESVEVELDILNFDKQAYAEILMDAFNQKRKLKRTAEFVQDPNYNKICEVAVRRFPLSFFRKRKHEGRILKHVEFGLRHLKGENRMYRVFTFNFNLTDLNNFERFYHARGDETTELKLFHGRRPITMNPEHEKYEELVPVKPITENDFVAGLIEKIQKKSGVREFYSRYYTHAGMAMRLDRFSVNRKKVPRAFVMVIIGGKQTQRIRIQEPPRLKNTAENDLYNLLD